MNIKSISFNKEAYTYLYSLEHGNWVILISKFLLFASEFKVESVNSNESVVVSDAVVPISTYTEIYKNDW